jgi:integrase
VVEYRGKPVLLAINHGWTTVVAKAGLATDIKQEKVIPHTLRHTAITLYLHDGVPIEQVADYCGVSAQTIRRVYKHHIPGGLDGVLAASHRLGRGRATVSQQKQTQ